MAVYTKITDADVEAHLHLYDIGKLQSLKGIAEGIQNSNYLLQTSKGQYILTLYEQAVKEEDLPFYLGLMEHLALKGINCPQPIKTSGGEILTTLCARPAVIVSYLNGFSVSAPTPSHCRQLGEMLAKMHEATNDIKLQLHNATGHECWRGFYDLSESRMAEIEPQLAPVISKELEYLQSYWPNDLPDGVIHADLFPDNVFFLEGELSGILDFYFAANDLLAYDLAICLNAWCFESDGSFNRQKSAALIGGYQRVRRLNANELDALPLLCRGASIRFLLTRIYDWLNVPKGAIVTPHDPLIYLGRLKFHQIVKDAGEYGFYGAPESST